MCRVAFHRYASLFLQPVTDDIAPNYSNTIYRPMDLTTLKKNLENGLVSKTQCGRCFGVSRHA